MFRFIRYLCNVWFVGEIPQARGRFLATGSETRPHNELFTGSFLFIWCYSRYHLIVLFYIIFHIDYVEFLTWCNWNCLTDNLYLKLDIGYRKLNGSFSDLHIFYNDAKDGAIIEFMSDAETIDLMSIEFPSVNTVKLFAVIGILF